MGPDYTYYFPTSTSYFVGLGICRIVLTKVQRIPCHGLYGVQFERIRHSLCNKTQKVVLAVMGSKLYFVDNVFYWYSPVFELVVLSGIEFGGIYV
jgi:hypothetical protein